MKGKVKDNERSPLGVASALRDTVRHPWLMVVSIVFMMAAAAIWLRVTTPLYSAEGELFIRGAVNETHYDNGHPFLADIGLSGESVDFSDEALRLTTPSLLTTVADTLGLRVSYRDSRFLKPEYVAVDEVPVIVKPIVMEPTFRNTLDIAIEGEKVSVKSKKGYFKKDLKLSDLPVRIKLDGAVLELCRNKRESAISDYKAVITSTNSCVRELQRNLDIYTPLEWNPILRCIVRAPSSSQAVAILNELQKEYTQTYRLARRDTLTSVMNYLEARSDTLRRELASDDIDNAQRQAKDSVYRYLQLRIEQTRLALGHNQDNNGWYTSPVPSDEPVYPKPFPVLFAAFITGICITPLLHYIIALFERE